MEKKLSTEEAIRLLKAINGRTEAHRHLEAAQHNMAQQSAEVDHIIVSLGLDPAVPFKLDDDGLVTVVDAPEEPTTVDGE